MKKLIHLMVLIVVLLISTGCAKLEAIPFADWWRTGRHEEFGVVSSKQQVSYFASHELTHLSQIKRLCDLFNNPPKGK